MAEADIKLRTARTLKWNTIDKFASQLLYAVTGVVLANLLSKEDFGLVGAMLVFQSFASLFVDSGFSSALIQKIAYRDRLLHRTVVQSRHERGNLCRTMVLCAADSIGFQRREARVAVARDVPVVHNQCHRHRAD